FLIQSTCPPVNENLMDLLVMVDSVKRASASRITAVIPYFGYARQDRKSHPRDPISAKLVANLLSIAGIDRLLTIDLHSGQIQGFFDVPVDNLSASMILGKYTLEKNLKNPIAVAPDVGGVKKVREFSDFIGTQFVVLNKHRPADNVAEVTDIIGDVKGKTAVMFDDMIDTGGTIVAGAEALLKGGAIEVLACCTHPVLSGNAVEKIAFSSLKELVTTNTIQLEPRKAIPKIRVLSIAPLLGEAIKKIHLGESVSDLFVKSHARR
ncbi:ribose-phosphate pyrophosphokinase, partial [Candidatus Micrarchaeota archaeon]|nr:ribose-phosphate pyrophosphokinase [Candidatus Micrarchaeota archaeon]